MDFKIGDFSKLSQVSVKTLRYYDEIGLFKPDHVDKASGYRYYSADQMSRLNRIIALKNLGFSLEQISIMPNLSAASLQEMLLQHKEQIKQQLASEQEKLVLVEARLKQIEKESDDVMSQNDVVLKSIDAQYVLSIRSVIPSYYEVGQLFEKLCTAIENMGGKFNEPGISIYYDQEYKEKDVDVEVAVPVPVGTKAPAGFEVRKLPAISKAACIIHTGSYENFNVSYGALMKWVAENDYRIAGPNREVYLRSDDQCSDPSQCITEIQLPVTK
jgi:effector-binding domain-containing protein